MTNDYMFRAVMQNSETALKHLLSALLDIPCDQIISCEITNPIILGNSIDDKTCIMDIRILLNTNRLINLEMQVGDLSNWPNRALFYLCKLFCNISKGQGYDKILPAMHIGILDQSPFDNRQDFYSEYLLLHTKTHHKFTGNFSLRMLDLSQTDTVTDEVRASALYYWACLFKAKCWEEICMLAEKNEGIRDAAVKLRVLSEEEKIQLQCEGRERYLMDMSCSRNEGYAEGMEDGLSKGQASINELHSRLLTENRIDDLKRSTTDPAFQKQLLEEYGISPRISKSQSL
ncbi:MAG: Rpn family recombination-promoting nuclease/putative transposase [Eubacteriales bacterium]|nr:Rpn family recombination-promoting nuclease/putative transposase [Eubacteriales bacterium]